MTKSIDGDATPRRRMMWSASVVERSVESDVVFTSPRIRFHKALLHELVNQEHARLGDAILTAKVIYAHTGFLPELLSIYHLLGDPALRMK